MTENKDSEEVKNLKREVAKLRLEGNLRKSLSNQLTIQKKIADDAKSDALAKSEELEKISKQLAKYLSPQIHEQIFSGKQKAEVKSNRKKLSVFFSDIVGFTDISDELESEEMTNLLNFSPLFSRCHSSIFFCISSLFFNNFLLRGSNSWTETENLAQNSSLLIFKPGKTSSFIKLKSFVLIFKSFFEVICINYNNLIYL